MSIEFLLTSLIIVATPGTGVLFTLAAGLRAGRRASLVAAIGCTLGIVPHLVAAMIGLAAVLHASALAFQTVKVLGVAYLLYLAWTTLRDQTAFMPTPAPTTAHSSRRIIGSAILVNLLNPKLSIFFLAFLPQFVSPGEADALPRLLGLSAVFMLLTLVVFTGYGIAAAVRHQVAARPRLLTWLRRGFAGAFVALGVRLALTDR